MVNLFGYVDLYAPQGRVGFTVTEIDVAGLLGDVARRRAELIARLRAEGLLGANNARSSCSAVPLRLGLVASPQTEGFADFTGQLLRSGLGFEVTWCPRPSRATPRRARSSRRSDRLDALGLDVDLRRARRRVAIATSRASTTSASRARSPTCATPVLTGIGHTGDESVADLVAHLAAITPTQLGEQSWSRGSPPGARPTCAAPRAACSTPRTTASTRRRPTSASAGAR